MLAKGGIRNLNSLKLLEILEQEGPYLMRGPGQRLLGLDAKAKSGLRGP